MCIISPKPTPYNGSVIVFPFTFISLLLIIISASLPVEVRPNFSVRTVFNEILDNLLCLPGRGFATYVDFFPAY